MKVFLISIVFIFILDYNSLVTAIDDENSTPKSVSDQNSRPGFSFFFKTVGHEDVPAFDPSKQGTFFNRFNQQQTDFANIFSQNLFNNQQNYSFNAIPGFNVKQPGVTGFNAIPGFNAQQPVFTIPGLNQQNDDEPLPSVEDYLEDESRADCELSLTTVNGKRVCRRRVIFVDDFKNEGNSMNKWTPEIFIPSYSSPISDTVFNYFDKNNTHFADGKLTITPAIVDDQFVRRGTLKLDGCSGYIDDECQRTAQFHQILPPVSSGRVTTKNSFSFKYGKIEIQAKFPEGDWLVPELWLVPKSNAYGEGLLSGRIVMAMARGNKNLIFNNVDINYKVLESSLIMSSDGRTKSRTLRAKSENPWQEHFHNYVFSWRPDGFSLSVNGKLIGEFIEKNFAGNLGNLFGFSHDEQRRWFRGSALAPFDQEFYISIGLSVGSRDFPDGSISGDYQKPWKNLNVKEILDFYRAKHKWLPTWNDEERRVLKINKIKITAL